MAAIVKTVLSSKGQVVLPKAVRDAKQWRPGAELEVVDTPEGVLLKPAWPFPVKTIDEVFGSVKYDGPPITNEEMERAVMDGVAEDYLASFDDRD